MTTKKLFSVLLIVFLTSLIIIPLVNAESFGKTDIGADTYNPSTNYMTGLIATSPSNAEGATVNSFTFYCYDNTDNYVKAVLVEKNTLTIVANGIGDPCLCG